ncbi:hypothetical protein [Priestia koreensis]|uniref:hypothetical protein n=1 Tax=Priestia koreensis TaxID=284581 RepID=UPI00345765DD
MDVHHLSQKRLRLLMIVGFILFGICVARIGYMKLIYDKRLPVMAQLDGAIEVMNTGMIDRVQTHFNINLDGYDAFGIDELIPLAKENPSALSLIEQMDKIYQEGCIGKPAAYVLDHKGYIFYRDAHGKNILLTLKEQQKEWHVITKKTS